MQQSDGRLTFGSQRVSALSARPRASLRGRGPSRAYNAHVRCLRDRLPPAVRVGPVDKFQGQQAPVVFYSMASSSADDVPRGLEFLFSRNRLNVAVSRAKALAGLVCSPRLLETRSRTVDQMRLVNGLCAFTEHAHFKASVVA